MVHHAPNIEPWTTDMNESLYETDLYGWTCQQARLLKSGEIDKADIPNIIEEIETLGRSQVHKLRSCYRLISLHLLKAIYQPQRASRIWKITIIRERNELIGVIRDNPGLKPSRESIFAEAYEMACKEAAAETEREPSTFPEVPPFNIGEVEDDLWLPTSLKNLPKGNRKSARARRRS